jgi:hypothetical protein
MKKPPKVGPPVDDPEAALEKIQEVLFDRPGLSGEPHALFGTSGGPLVQTGLRLNAEMLERLRATKKGLSDEIRERLERTFAEDRISPITRRMRDEILALTHMLRDDFGEWYATRRAYAEFVTAVTTLLARYEPIADPPSNIDEPLGAVAKTRVRDLLRQAPNNHLQQLDKERRMRQLDVRRSKEEKHGEKSNV